MNFLKGLMLVVAWGASTPTESQGTNNSAFSGVCDESSSRTFVVASNFDGVVDKDSWSRKRTIGPEQLTVSYDGVSIQIDGESAYTLEQNKGVLIADRHAKNAVDATAWLYTIHPGLNRMVATLSGGYGSEDGRVSSIYATTIDFKCKFD